MFRLCVATVFLLGSILVAQEKPQPPAPHPYPPQSKEPPGPPASELDNKHREAKVPSVNVPEQDARAAVNSFITWASASDVRQREEVRRMIAASRENKPVSAALCEEAFQAREKDHSRAVVVLSLLGEMRSETGGGRCKKRPKHSVPGKRHRDRRRNCRANCLGHASGKGRRRAGLPSQPVWRRSSALGCLQTPFANSESRGD